MVVVSSRFRARAFGGYFVRPASPVPHLLHGISWHSVAAFITCTRQGTRDRFPRWPRWLKWRRGGWIGIGVVATWLTGGLSPQSLEVKAGLTHRHESNTLTLWLNGCKSSSRIPNTGKYSGLRDHGTCLWRSGFAKRWSPRAGRSRWAVQARSLTQFGSRCSTNILPETLQTCLLKSKQAMERARARDFR
jgi:hypothetical protein